MPHLPGGLIAYGPDENCTLALCPIESSIFHYQPSIAANSVFIALFGIAALIHLIQGIHYKTWGFMVPIILGCIDEIIGYAGRLIMNPNPFSFSGFLMQAGKVVVCNKNPFVPSDGPWWCGPWIGRVGVEGKGKERDIG